MYGPGHVSLQITTQISLQTASQIQTNAANTSGHISQWRQRGCSINPRRHRPFRILPRHKGGGGWYDPLAVSPLIELELRERNERVARHELKKLIYKLNVLDQPVTSDVRSSAEKWRKSVITDNFASDGARTKFQHPACSLRRVEHVTMVFECPWIIFMGQKFKKSFSGHMTSLTFDDPVVPWPYFKSS